MEVPETQLIEQLAAAQAEAGDFSGARMTVAERIPDDAEKADAYGAIAYYQAKAGQAKEALRWAESLDHRRHRSAALMGVAMGVAERRGVPFDQLQAPPRRQGPDKKDKAASRRRRRGQWRKARHPIKPGRAARTPIRLVDVEGRPVAGAVARAGSAGMSICSLLRAISIDPGNIGCAGGTGTESRFASRHARDRDLRDPLRRRSPARRYPPAHSRRGACGPGHDRDATGLPRPVDESSARAIARSRKRCMSSPGASGGAMGDRQDRGEIAGTRPC